MVADARASLTRRAPLSTPGGAERGEIRGGVPVLAGAPWPICRAMQSLRRFAALLVVLSGCGPRLASRAAPEPPLDPARAGAEVAWLADPSRTGRGTRSGG